MTDSLRENPAAHAFVSTAERFCTLLEHPVRDRDLWLADILTTLATLYAAAQVFRELGLPEESKEIPADFKLTNDEWNTLFHYLRSLLGDLDAYSAHFNPISAQPADEPTMGSLADDLADIYRDIKPGLSAWHTGDDDFLHAILFQWLEIGFRHHWGRHATDALRALHWLVYK